MIGACFSIVQLLMVLSLQKHCSDPLSDVIYAQVSSLSCIPPALAANSDSELAGIVLHLHIPLRPR